MIRRLRVFRHCPLSHAYRWRWCLTLYKGARSRWNGNWQLGVGPFGATFF